MSRPPSIALINARAETQHLKKVIDELMHDKELLNAEITRSHNRGIRLSRERDMLINLLYEARANAITS